MTYHCQVLTHRTAQPNPCPGREGGGLQCELERGHWGEHYISPHTIKHSLAGNGYDCYDSEGRLW